MKKKIILVLAMALTIGYIANSREDGKGGDCVVCGGEVSIKYNCFLKEVNCEACEGSGIIKYKNGKVITCGACEGTGKALRWFPCVICTRCGKTYELE